MHYIPKECIADSVASSADVYAVFSASEEWIIYCDKDWEVSIIAFKNDNYRQIFADICLPGLQYDPFKIPEFIQEDLEAANKLQEFKDNWPDNHS